MFAYEMHQDRTADLRRRADEWRLAEQARAACATERRAARTTRRTQGRAAARGDEGADGAASPTSPRTVGSGRRTVTARLHHAFHPHHAA